MAISDRITSIEEHIKESYQELEGLGIDTTEVNKNLENIPKLIDGYWETLPKVTEEGTSITLDNTKEGKMKINLKGNTSQETTTGKNLLNLTNGSTTSNGVTATRENGKLKITGKATQNWFSICSLNIELEAGAYVFSYTNKKAFRYNLGVRYADSTTTIIYGTSVETSTTITLTQNATLTSLFSDNNTIGTDFDYEDFLMIEKGSTATSYEPYTNGASPNPDYPQDVHVVSGDNTINICGKNLFHFESQRNTGWYSDVPNMIKEIGAYTLSINDTSLSGVWAVWFADNNGDRIGDFIKPSSSVSTPSTFNVTQEQANAPYIRILPNASGLHDIQNYKIQIEKDSTATTYEPYQEQNYSVNLGVKNLFDGELEQGSYDGSGAKSLSNINYRNKNIIAVKPNTTYTFSIDGISQKYCTYYYDTNQTLLSMDLALATGTFTTPNNCYYLNFRCFQADYVNNFASLKVQLEEGSKANSYTPYGTTPIEMCKIGDYQDSIVKDNGKWFLHKEIGKVVFDGSESWAINTSYTYNVFYRTLDNYARISNTQTTYCEYYKGIENTAGIVDFGNNYNNSIGVRTANDNIKDIYISNNSITSASDFKIWLSTHNTVVYYVLATPTTTEITDSTLISQLEALNGAKSYTTQTNINQENNDNASILNATALENM